MKIGKFIQLGYHENIKIGYGSVDCVNLKTVYLKLNSWVEPIDEIDFNSAISKTKRSIVNYFYALQNNTIRKECIVDIDIKTKGVKIDKRSFMDIEITLYTIGQHKIKNKIYSSMIQDMLKNIIDNILYQQQIFNYYKTKE